MSSKSQEDEYLPRPVLENRDQVSTPEAARLSSATSSIDTAERSDQLDVPIGQPDSGQDNAEKLRHEIAIWVSRIVVRDQRIFELQRKLDEMRHQLSFKNREIERLSATIRDEQISRAQAMNELHESYKSSTSWKASAPIRVLGRFLKRRG